MDTHTCNCKETHAVCTAAWPHKKQKHRMYIHNHTHVWHHTLLFVITHPDWTIRAQPQTGCCCWCWAGLGRLLLLLLLVPGQPGHGLGRLLLLLVPGHGLGRLLLLLVLKTAPASRHAGVRRRDLPTGAPFLLIFRPLRSGARFLLISRALAILTATPLWCTTCTIPPDLPPPPSEPPPPLPLPRSFARLPNELLA